MPMYDYRCKACGARFEAWQKFSDDPISVCPTCSGPAQRVIHAAGIMFKGSGFYSTDSKSASAIPPTDATAPVASAEKPNDSAASSDGASTKPASGDAAKPSPTAAAPAAPATKAS